MQGHSQAGESLKEGPYTFTMEEDCNLVLYHCRQPIWHSNTYNRSSNCRFTLQSDGNGVLYTGCEKPIFSTNTHNRKDGSHVIVVQADGNVVMYNAVMAAIWATNTQLESIDLDLGGDSTSGHGPYYY